MGTMAKRWMVTALRIPLLVVGFILRPIYGLLFSRYDKKLARRNYEVLAKDIQDDLPFVFGELAGYILPDKSQRFPRYFDYAVVTVETSVFELKFTRGRGELTVQVAPKFSPDGWHELSTILFVIDIPGVKRGSIATLRQAGDLIRQNMNAISSAMSENKYPEIKAQLVDLSMRDRIVAKQLETEINRKIYG